LEQIKNSERKGYNIKLGKFPYENEENEAYSLEKHEVGET
jgi:hypothetical protein